MALIRCENFEQGCPFADGNAHEAETLDEFRLHKCEVLTNGGQCKAYVEGTKPREAGEGSFARVSGVLYRSRAVLLIAISLLILVGAGYGIYKKWIQGPECEIGEAKKLLTLDPKVGELEQMGEACLDAGMQEADADKIVTGTVLLRGALDRKSSAAAWLLGRLFDPLKRPELEEQSEVPTLLPAVDPREALRFYDLAGPGQEEAVAAAAALRAKYPELRLTAAGKGGTPLGMPGHQGLLQRILTKPGAELFAQPGGSGQGQPLPPFSLYYVLETRPGWVRVGEQLAGSATGWIAADMAQEWNVMLVMRYAPPDNRQPALFFRDELAAKSLLTQPGAGAAVADLLESAKGDLPDPRLVAIEDRTVDWSASPYLMPILKTSPIVTDSGRKVFLAQIAAVNGAGRFSGGPAQIASAGGSGSGTCRGGSPETAVHQIAFVIDTTASMGPYIEGVRKIADYWSQEVARRGIATKVRFAVVAYRNNMDAEPQKSGLEYVTRTYLPLAMTSDAGAFSQAMKEIHPAKVSTHSFDEDAVAGLDSAIRLNWGQGCGVKMIFLVTDAGSLKSDDPKGSLPGTGLTTIAATAKEQGISIFPVHVLTREARDAANVEKASQQYRGELADGRGVSLYRSISGGSTKAFNDYLVEVGSLLDGIQNEAQGKFLQGTKPIAAGDQAPQPTVKELVLGKLFAVQQRFLGAAAGADAPAFNASWTSDRDLSNPDVAAFDVSIYLTRRQLSQLAEKCQSLLSNAQQARTESGRFFDLLRMVSAATAQDPTRFTNSSADLSALMPSFLSLLPYKSDVLSLTAQDWRGMGATKQDAFVRRLNEKVSFYRRIEADQSRWVQLSGSDPNDQVALVPLKEMP